MPVTRCDIFCKVIDNFGDIGVCWRLARQLTAGHGLSVRLWCDDLASFAPLAPALDPARAEQTLADVTICRWDHRADSAIPAELVIEAFACDPPAPYIEAMAKLAVKPVWINLEYLSAEDWVEGSHGLPSPHPRLPLVKHFFFPGFTARTGGLLRETGLMDAHAAFQHDAAAQAAWWRTLGQVPPPGALKLSLFAYENAAVAGLLDAWANSPREIFCAVPAGRIGAQIDAWLASRSEAGETARIGALTLARLPFLPQPDYDRLLAACDLNFVRGEDSFVRAQWVARPFVWHIYPQQDAAHLPKLEAFLALYCAGLEASAARALRDFWRAWEAGHKAGERWPAFAGALPALQAHASVWTAQQARHADLAAKLLIFCQNLLECRAL